MDGRPVRPRTQCYESAGRRKRKFASEKKKEEARGRHEKGKQLRNSKRKKIALIELEGEKSSNNCLFERREKIGE